MKRTLLVSAGLILGCGEYASAFGKHVINRSHWSKSTLDAAVNLQSEEDFDRWISEENLEREYQDFLSYLTDRNVSDSVESWQLMRQGTDWEEAGHSPFSMPPRDKWHEIIPTLELIRDEVIPEIGAVEVVSGYRTREYNAIAGGSRNSQHLYFSAVDLIPKKRISRDTLISSLRGIYVESGDHRHMGLGIYSSVRFHVDTHRKRTW
tara:strand:- start:6495 stop:7115 length:621 start_codon:yes stop_codon:yes gene_type:complete